MRTLQNKRWIILPLVFLFLILFLFAAQAEGAQVSGRVYYDRNNNGKMDGNESGIVGAKVILQRRDAEGKTKDLSTKTIDREADYAFAVNQAGEYRLRVELPKEYYFTVHGKGSRVLPTQKNKGVTDFFVLEDGSAEQADVGGIKNSVAITVVAFVDANANGGRANNEPLLRGVEGELVYEYEGKTHTVARVTSDKSGNMSIRDLSPAPYVLRVTLPDNYVIGPKGEKNNTWYNSMNAGENGTGYSNVIDLEPGHNAGLGVGAVKTGSLRGNLWYDENFNGVKDPGEGGLSDATVFLISPSLNLTRETAPDADGLYSFTGLQPGEYKVGVQLADGLVFTYPGQSQISTIGSYGETAAYVEVEKTATVREIGAMPAARASLSFFVDDNLNGQMDPGEKALPGVAVTVSQNGQKVETKFSRDDGAVAFASLRSGTAEIVCKLPDGYIFELGDQAGIAFKEITASCTLQGTMNDENGNAFSAALAVTVPAAIRGRLFEDPLNAGVYTDECGLLPGFTVLAVNEAGEALAEADTDEKGEYTLYPLHAGTYTVQFLLNDPYVASPHTEDNSIVNQTPARGETEAVALQPGQQVTGVDGAVFRAGVVDGKTLNASGDGGLRGITVWLLNQDKQPVSDFSYGVTDENGDFLIKGVLPGTYFLRFDIPDTVALTDPQTEQKQVYSSAFEIKSGAEMHAQALRGVYTASISGFVGRQGADAVEAKLTLTSESTGKSVTAVSENGAYAFTGLRPGSYSLIAELPEGYVFGQLPDSPFGPRADQADEISVTLDQEDHLQADIRAALPVNFSGVVYYDANRSAQQEEQESGAPDRTLALWLGNTKAAEAVTDENGEFHFSRLVPGDYTLRMTLQDNEVMVGMDAEQQENEWIVPVSLDEDQFLAVPVLRYAVVTGTVWNLDGSLNQVGGITVSLLDEYGTSLGSISTNSEGAFGFSRLLPGTYSLSAELPKGFLFARSQDTQQRKSMIQTQDGGQSLSIPFTVPMGKKVTGMDIGMGSIGRIGDKAWLDENGNGLQDIGEVGMPGIKIDLYKNGELVASATTDLYGRYSMDNLYPGEYEMRVTMHAELKATRHDLTFPLVASIMPESSDTTVVFSGVVVPSGGENLHCDLGFQLRKPGVYPAVMSQIPTKDWTPYSERK